MVLVELEGQVGKVLMGLLGEVLPSALCSQQVVEGGEPGRMARVVLRAVVAEAAAWQELIAVWELAALLVEATTPRAAWLLWDKWADSRSQAHRTSIPEIMGVAEVGRFLHGTHPLSAKDRVRFLAPAAEAQVRALIAPVVLISTLGPTAAAPVIPVQGAAAAARAGQAVAEMASLERMAGLSSVERAAAAAALSLAGQA